MTHVQPFKDSDRNNVEEWQRTIT